MKGKIILVTVFILSFLILFIFSYKFILTGFFDEGDELWIIADILGLVGYLMLWWEFVIGTRSVLRIFTVELTWSNELHGLLAKYGFIFITLHPVLMLIDNWIQGFNLTILGFETQYSFWVSVGTIGFIILAVIWVLSAFLKEKIGFRPWKMIHLLNYFLFVLVYFHSVNSGIFLESPLLKTYFDILFVIFIFIVIYRILFQFGILGRAKYKVKSIVYDTPNVIDLTLSPINKVLKSRPGQYLYLQKTGFWRSSSI